MVGVAATLAIYGSKSSLFKVFFLIIAGSLWNDVILSKNINTFERPLYPSFFPNQNIIEW